MTLSGVRIPIGTDPIGSMALSRQRDTWDRALSLCRFTYRSVLESTMSITRPSPVLSHALPLPIMSMLQHRRVVLASSSPRRKDILEVAVSCM